MNISKNSFDKASDTLFTFQFTNVPKILTPDQSSNLLLNCNTVSIPGVSVNVAREHWQGAYLKYAMGNITFDSISVNFLVDEDISNWKTLFKWVTFANNNRDKFGIEWSENNSTGILEYYNNYMNKVVLKMTFNHIWCSGVGAIQLTTKTDGSQYLEANGVFEFDHVNLD